MYKQITVSGPDALEFLQGQLTQDVSLLAEDDQLPAAWCNPKGRVITTVRLLGLGAAYGVVLPASITDAVLNRLTLYRLRAKVAFAVDESTWISSIPGEHADPVQLILSGIPTIDASNSEKYTPHMLNLDKLGAISFTKGCYTGQEVVARTENLGTSKRRMMLYRAADSEMRVGDKLVIGERSVGTIVNAASAKFLAVLPIELHEADVMVNGVTATPLGLSYLN